MTDKLSKTQDTRPRDAVAMVKAEGVHKSFGQVEVLKGIDLEVKPGEVFCLIGPSGSGKSTFLRCINHLEKINAGRLYVDGELVGYRQQGDKLYELRDREVAMKRRDIGMVFQRFNLFPHMTAAENVMEAPVQVKGVSRGEARERAMRLLERVGLADRAGHYPPSFPAASSSGWRSPGRWRWSRS
ncbi:amino acid ABC transporter ATP-binding protein [Streptomyces nogalater]